MNNVNIEWKYIWIDRKEVSEKIDSEVITSINFDIVEDKVLKYRIHYRKERDNNRFTDEFFGGNIRDVEGSAMEVFKLMLEASLNKDTNTSYKIIITQTYDDVDKIAINKYINNKLDISIDCDAYLYKRNEVEEGA